VGGYALVLALIAAKDVKDRDGSRLGAYFVLVPGIWVMEILLLLIIVGYVAGLLVLTSERVRLARWVLPAGIGLGTATAAVLYLLAPLGVTVDPNGPSLKWWGLAALALPLVTGFPAPPPGGGCETCDPNQVVIPPGLRHEYWAELSVGQAGMAPLAALKIGPFVGAWLGVLGGGLARRLPATRRRGTGGADAPVPGREPVGRPVAWGAFGVMGFALLAAAIAVPGPTPTDDNRLGLVLFLAAALYFIAWLAAFHSLAGRRGAAGQQLAFSARPRRSHGAGFARCA
jgi:hypothetical protein